MKSLLTFNTDLEYDLEEIKQQAIQKIEQNRLYILLTSDDGNLIPMDKIIGVGKNCSIFENKLFIEWDLVKKELKELSELPIELKPVGEGVVKNKKVEDYKLKYFALNKFGT